MTPRGFLARSFLAAPALVAALCFATPAAADVPPPNNCEGSQAGDACENAGASADQAGTCVASSCQELNYHCDGGNGGPCGTTTYSCLVCTAGDGGASTSTSSSAATHTHGSGSSSDTASNPGGGSTSSPVFFSDQATSSTSSFTPHVDPIGPPTGSSESSTLPGDASNSSGGCSSSGGGSSAMGGLFMLGLIALGVRGSRPARGTGWSTPRSRRRRG